MPKLRLPPLLTVSAFDERYVPPETVSVPVTDCAPLSETVPDVWLTVPLPTVRLEIVDAVALVDENVAVPLLLVNGLLFARTPVVPDTVNVPLLVTDVEGFNVPPVTQTVAPFVNVGNETDPF
jgi:hypothetical protein